LAYVKEEIGHHSIQITVNTYGHLIPGANRQAVIGWPRWSKIRNLYETGKKKRGQAGSKIMPIDHHAKSVENPAPGVVRHVAVKSEPP